MPPKRSAPAPQPPPRVESSEGTDSGSEEYESESEQERSPPTATSKKMAPPPQKVQQPESSDDEEEEDEEEEVEESEEEEEANHTDLHHPSATQNPPPPPPNREESESDEEEEEDTDDEEPPPEPSPKQESKAKGGKPPSVGAPKQDAKGKGVKQSAPKQEDAKANGGKPLPSSDSKKPFQRSWSKDDEIRILEALAAHRREHGKLPPPEDLEATLAGKLDNTDYSSKEFAGKLKSLRAMYNRVAKSVKQPSKDADRRIFDLSKEVWGGAGGGSKSASGTVPSDFGEMCKMYPYLGEEMKELERKQKGLFKRGFSLIDNDQASRLDEKIKKHKVSRMKLELRGQDVVKEVTKVLMNLIN